MAIPSDADSIQETLLHEVGFRLIVDPVWSLSPARIESVSTGFVSLHMTNRSSRVLHFNRFDTLRLTLSDAQGRVYLLDGGRDATRPAPAISPPIQPGASHEIRLPAELVRMPGGQGLRWLGAEDFGGIWYFDDLTPGTYFLMGIYENDRSRIGEGEPVWTGRVETPVCVLKIME